MSTRRSTEARTINRERRTAERDRSSARRQGRCAKHLTGDARYRVDGRLA